MLTKAGVADNVMVTRTQLVQVCRTALLAAGASAAQAEALAEATTQAEERGLRLVGVAHLPDYLDGLRCGRIKVTEPVATARTPVLRSVDCRDGIAQHGFAVVVDDLVSAARSMGFAVASFHHSYTVGELGHYVRELVSRGLVAVAVANSPALMSVAGAGRPMFGTNPHSFGAPLPNGGALMVDQASSATAWVAIRTAAERGEPIAAGLAVDPSGAPTTSAVDGLAGAMLPFGGYKGGNIALLVELLTTLGGAAFSSEAAPFERGEVPPRVGMVVVAVSADVVSPGYIQRLGTQLDRWESDLGADTSVWLAPRPTSLISVPRRLLEQLHAD